MSLRYVSICHVPQDGRRVRRSRAPNSFPIKAPSLTASTVALCAASAGQH